MWQPTYIYIIRLSVSRINPVTECIWMHSYTSLSKKTFQKVVAFDLPSLEPCEGLFYSCIKKIEKHELWFAWSRPIFNLALRILQMLLLVHDLLAHDILAHDVLSCLLWQEWPWTLWQGPRMPWQITWWLGDHMMSCMISCSHMMSWQLWTW